jgi:hypothetical protein
LIGANAILAVEELQTSSGDDEVGLEWIIVLWGITSPHH